MKSLELHRNIYRTALFAQSNVQRNVQFHLMNTQQYGIENEARTAVEIWFEKLEQPLILAKNSSYKFSSPERMIYFTTALFSPKNIPAKLQPKVQTK